MEKAIILPQRGKLNLDLIHFPSYAQNILHSQLEDFIKELIVLYDKSDIPLVRFFQSMDRDQWTALVTASVREMLTLIAANKANQYIEQTINNWLNNELPLITREQVHLHDITRVNYARRSLFRSFLSRYTADREISLQIIDEIDRFTVVLDSELFGSYIELQQEKINSINRALQKREQQLLEAQEIAQIGSFDWDFSGRNSSYTAQVFKIFEMEKSTNLADFLDYVHREDREKLRAALDKAFVGGQYECEYRYNRNNKDKIIFSKGRVVFEDGRPQRMIGTIADVTERQKIIQRLQESEKLHMQAQALTHIGNWAWAIDDNKVTWSDEMYRIYGLPPQSEQITLERFLSFVHPDDKEKRLTEIQKSLETLSVAEYHFTIVAADGTSKVLRGKGEVVTDHDNKPVVMLGTCQDITREFILAKQLREREKYLRQLNRSLEFANRELIRTNEELESFNFVASHDLQEPLRKIQIYSNRILETAALPEQLQEYFQKINKASNRMQNLIEDFLRFSRTFSTPQVPEEVDIKNIVEEIIAELSNRIEEKQAIIETCDLPAIWAVPFHLKQLMINLVSNALKYTQPGVAPHIKITGSMAKGSEIPVENAEPEMSYIRISVADNGIGFEAKYRAKIFELFQRLHSRNVYSGTGIGLALCKKIVQHMNGFITADSVPQRGSVFTFYIPAKFEKPIGP